MERGKVSKEWKERGGRKGRREGENERKTGKGERKEEKEGR